MKGLLAQGEIVGSEWGITKARLLTAVRRGELTRVAQGKRKGLYRRSDVVGWLMRSGERDRAR